MLEQIGIEFVCMPAEGEESSTGETVERISTNTQTVTDVYANCLRVWLIKFDNTNTSHTVTAKVTASSSASKTYGAHAMIFAY